MKHTTSRMLFAYWDALRGERAAPDRADIRPGGIRHILADTFMLASSGEEGAVFRLAGTRCGALFCRTLGGTRFADLWRPEAVAEPEHLLDTVLGDTVGLVASLNAWNANGSALPLELIMLPLRHRGRADTRLIGALSPSSIPSWAGLVPLDDLRVASLRTIQAPSRPGFGDRSGVPGSRRSLFVIHEGGRVAG